MNTTHPASVDRAMTETERAVYDQITGALLQVRALPGEILSDDALQGLCSPVAPIKALAEAGAALAAARRVHRIGLAYPDDPPLPAAPNHRPAEALPDTLDEPLRLVAAAAAALQRSPLAAVDPDSVSALTLCRLQDAAAWLEDAQLLLLDALPF